MPMLSSLFNFNFNSNNENSFNTNNNQSADKNITINNHGNISISNEAAEKEKKSEGKKQIFISHASEDKKTAKKFADFLRAIGVPDEKIICSTDPEALIPLGEDFKAYIHDALKQEDTMCFILLSDNFIKKAYCNAECGIISWAGLVYYFIELPGFKRANFSTLLNKNKISICLNDKNNDDKKSILEARLAELRDILCQRYNLTPPNDAAWAAICQTFLN